jgi:hypothetical protein
MSKPRSASMEAMRPETGEWVVDASAMVLSVPWNAGQKIRPGKHEIMPDY